MKKETSKINIFKKCKIKFNDFIVKLAYKFKEEELRKTSELIDGYTNEVKEYLDNHLKGSNKALLNGVEIEVLPLGTSIEDYHIPNLTEDKKVLLIELSVFKPTIKLEYANILWQVRFNFLYLTEQVKVTSAKDKFEKYIYQVDVLLPILSPLKGKKMKHGEMKKDDIELISIRTIPKSNSSRELKSTIYKGYVHLRKRHQVRWENLDKIVKKMLLALGNVVLRLIDLSVLG